MTKKEITNKVIQFDYTDLHTKTKLMKYCELANFNLSSVPHSKMKNYVMNYLYMNKDLKPNEILIFIFLYDFKSQQKYLSWLVTNNKKISFMTWIHDSIVSKSIKRLIDFNLLIKWKNKFDEKVLLINENIDTWKVNLYENELSILEELRKHCASSNKQLTEEYKAHKLKMISQENIAEEKPKVTV